MDRSTAKSPGEIAPLCERGPKDIRTVWRAPDIIREPTAEELGGRNELGGRSETRALNAMGATQYYILV